eukprot:6489597-Prorocentrum_lima.AAC.1
MAVFGSYTGGELKVWPRDSGRGSLGDIRPEHATTIDTHGALLLFDGSKAHQALPATGKRFSVLWYTTARWEPLHDEARQELCDLGFAPPNARDERATRDLQAGLVRSR